MTWAVLTAFQNLTPTIITLHQMDSLFLLKSICWNEAIAAKTDADIALMASKREPAITKRTPTDYTFNFLPN